MIMIKVMGSFFRKLIFVANTCAIITQIDIHLFIHSFIHSSSSSSSNFLFVSGPICLHFSNFSTTKIEEKKKRANNNNNNGEENVIFFSFIV